MSSNPFGAFLVFSVLILGICAIYYKRLCYGLLKQEILMMQFIKIFLDQLIDQVFLFVQGNRKIKIFYCILMLSYLANRHYHLLTKELPQELRVDQPKVVYLPAHNGQKILQRNDRRSGTKLKMKRSKQIQQTVVSLGDCCPTCFSTENISVEYYGKKHVCIKCRKLIRDQHGNQIRIFLNEMGQIMCLGIKAVDKSEDNHKKIYYLTDYTRLNINGRSAFATFSTPQQMVVILRMPQLNLQ